MGGQSNRGASFPRLKDDLPLSGEPPVRSWLISGASVKDAALTPFWCPSAEKTVGARGAPLPDWRSRRRSRSVTPRMICTCPDCLPAAVVGTFDRGPGFASPPPPSALLSESLTTACPLARCRGLSLSPMAHAASYHAAVPLLMPWAAMRMRGLRPVSRAFRRRLSRAWSPSRSASRLELSGRIGPRLKMSWLISAHRR